MALGIESIILMRDRLVFYVNDQRREALGNVASLTLSDYLRQGLAGSGLIGTKIACAEGDCGACTVLVGRAEASGESFVYQTVDACIAFVYQFDRCHIITVEGLAKAGQPSEVQTAMIDCHGSQCGFCTPGFVMALAGLAEQSEGPLSDEELRLGLSGNLCRCTGYSQILDAGLRCDGANLDLNAQFDTKGMLEDFGSLGVSGVHIPAPNHGNDTGVSVEIFLPSTVDEMLAALSENPESLLISGATDIGVQFNHEKISPSQVITTRHISELQEMKVVENDLVIGAGVTWSRIEDFTREAIPEYHAILTRFGSPQVRHMGTLAGNLANASPIADSIPFHYVAESTLDVGSSRGTRSIPINEFYQGYKQLDLASDEAILSVRTPMPSGATRLKLYKVSKRRDMDISTVTLAFWIEMEGESVRACRIAAGGVGPTVMRLPRAERGLRGQPFTLEAMESAGKVAREEVTPISDVRGSAGFRALLIENLFSKCWHDLVQEPLVA